MPRIQLELADGDTPGRVQIHGVRELHLPASLFKRRVDPLTGGFFRGVLTGQADTILS